MCVASWHPIAVTANAATINAKSTARAIPENVAGFSFNIYDRVCEPNRPGQRIAPSIRRPTIAARRHCLRDTARCGGLWLSLDYRIDSTNERASVKPARMFGDRGRGELRRLSFEIAYRSVQRIGRLFVEKHSRPPFHDCLQRAAASVRDHGLPGRHRFNRNDSEVFEAGENQSPATSVLFTNHLERLPSDKPHVGSRQGAQIVEQCALADYRELPAAAVERGNRQIDPLVRHKLTDYQVLVIFWFRRRKRADIDWRMHHLRFALIIGAHALSHESRIGYKGTDSSRAFRVPHPHRVGDEPHGHPARPAQITKMLLVKIPDIAHRRMAVA